MQMFKFIIDGARKLFYSQENNEYWDGTYNNKPLPIADYYYIIEPINGKVITGRVTIKEMSLI